MPGVVSWASLLPDPRRMHRDCSPDAGQGMSPALKMHPLYYLNYLSVVELAMGLIYASGNGKDYSGVILHC